MKLVFLIFVLVLGFIIAGIIAQFSNESMISSQTDDINEYSIQEKRDMKIKVKVIANGNETEFELNNSQASQDLYAQLPLNVEVEDYGNNEKIFYPPKKLDITSTPQANAQAGTLAYYAPWGNVVMFYKRFGAAAGLYELGRAVSGSEHIEKMSGKIEIKTISR